MPVYVLLLLIRFLILILTLINELILWKVYSKSVQDVLHKFCVQRMKMNSGSQNSMYTILCSRTLLEKLTALLLVKKFPALYGT